jgi:hypothetical protein
MTATMNRGYGDGEIGWREWIALPDLDLPAVKAKVDTGARTSALHAWHIAAYNRGGAPWIAFCIHPLQRQRQLSRECHAPVHDRRLVSDSGGHRERRYVIETTLVLGQRHRTIEITLTDRDTMLFRMLIGRQALRGLRVVPTASFITAASLTPTQAAAHYESSYV